MECRTHSIRLKVNRGHLVIFRRAFKVLQQKSWDFQIIIRWVSSTSSKEIKKIKKRKIQKSDIRTAKTKNTH